MLFGTTLQATIKTILSTLHVFVKAMLLHPECMAKAQDELNQIISPDRLPVTVLLLAV